MARSRNLKPGFFKNEYLAELNPLTRILFEGLWILADREGRLEDRPKKIKAEVLPYDDCDVNKMLDELMNSKEQFIIRYEVNGNRYIQIVNFLKHQTPHSTEIDSIIPGLPKDFESTSEKSQSTSEKDRKSSIEVISNKESVISKEDRGMGEGEKLELEKLPYAEVVEYLNLKANTKYRSTTKSTREFIRARLNENFTLDDFKTVIDKKCAEWLNTDQEQYLRPETLFCAKHFESYLNQKSRDKPPNRPPGKPPQVGNFEQRKYSNDEIDKLYKV
jgi:uncharacterized phage protein (TIGR02220 family)